MKRIVYHLVFWVSLLGIMSGCSHRFNNDDTFYNDLGGWDALRIPLIKPYEAILSDDNIGWIINLVGSATTNHIYGSIPGVEKIGVIEDKIFIYSGTSIYQGNVDPFEPNSILRWFVLLPANNIEMGFYTEEEFIQYIETIGIKEIEWEVPSKIYQRFEKTGCLPWIPGCE